MASRKSSLRAPIEYIALRGLYGLLRKLPPALGEALCRKIMQLLLLVMPRRREIMQDNLATCFPETPQSQREAVALQSVQNLARGLALYPRVPSLCRQQDQFNALVRPEGFGFIKEALEGGRGVILFTAHYGLWEMMAIYVSQLYPRVAMVARPLDNPLLEKLVLAVRTAGGGAVIASRRLLKEGVRHLRENGMLGLLVDQNFHKGGIFVDFFGRPAATTTIVSWLARRTGSVVLPMHNHWEGGLLRIICEGPFPLSQNPVPKLAVAEDTQNMTKIIEGWIRDDPGQWLWLHNRWKRRPGASDFVYVQPTLDKLNLPFTRK